MSLPNAYLTSFKNAGNILRAMQSAQAPSRFTQKFLEGIGFPSSNDRTMINMLKALGFIDDAIVLAEGIREAYQDLFRININAHEMPVNDVKNKMKTLSEGQFTDRVLTQMAGTFCTLVREADFVNVDTPAATSVSPEGQASDEPVHMEVRASDRVSSTSPASSGFGRLVYDIHIHLPESRDQAVYDALFKAIKEHLA